MRIEDRDNDWLAQEMLREGYVKNENGLKREHKKEELAKNWEAGAISIKNEHETAHLKERKKESVELQPIIIRSKDREFTTKLFVLFILLMILIIKMIMY